MADPRIPRTLDGVGEIEYEHEHEHGVSGGMMMVAGEAWKCVRGRSTMTNQDDRRYSISEVSELTGTQAHVLRQWEDRFPQLKPKRDRANRRYYVQADIDVVRRLKELLWHEKLTTEGARKRLDQELRGEGRPKTRHEAVALLDELEQEARAMLDILDSGNSS